MQLDLGKVTGESSGRNLLDNWYFADPINQREISGVFSSVGSYFIDRWVLTGGSVEITDAGLKLNGTIEQRFERAFGSNVTAAALSTTGFADAEYDDEGKKLQITANGETVIAAKLELGDEQTLAHLDNDGNWVLNDPPPDPALELTKCRYYQKVLNAIDGSTYGDVGIGKGWLNGNCMILIYLGPHRIVPAVSHIGNWSLSTGYTDVIPLSEITVEPSSNSVDYVTLRCQAETPSQVNLGEAYILRTNKDENAKLILDMNL